MVAHRGVGWGGVWLELTGKGKRELSGNMEIIKMCYIVHLRSVLFEAASFISFKRKERNFNVFLID